VTRIQTISNLNTFNLKINNQAISSIYVPQNGGNMYDSLVFQKSTSGNPAVGYFDGMGARVVYQLSTTTTDYACSIGINNTTKKFWFSASSNYAYEYWFGGANTLIISSNVLSYDNGIINATTLQQNSKNITDVCSNIVLTQTPNIPKRNLFQFNCSTSIVMPNNQTLFKHDIDLRLYTNTKIIPNPSSPFRIFKIKLWIASGYFSYKYNGNANVLEYTIYQSLQSQNGSPYGNGGQNTYAIGTPNNPDLNSVTGGQISLCCSADFNYLSCLAITNGTLVYCHISDELF